MILKILSNTIKIPSLYFFLRKSFKVQKIFMEKSILLDLKDIDKDNDQSLTEKDFTKIRQYYGLAVPIIGEIFCLLRGIKMTSSERRTLTYLGGLTGLFDDFFDEKDTPVEHIKELINNPAIEICKNVHEKLFVRFYLKALAKEGSEQIKSIFNSVYKAQVLSKQQTDEDLSSEDILNITKQKGGVSILFYRSALNGRPSETEKELLMKIGLLGQLENDIFDIYQDYQEKIHTLATRTSSIKNLRAYYQSILNDVYNLIEQSGFPKRNKMRFARFIAIIAARGLVCLDQLEKLENDNRFNLQKYSREELICDMGTFKNTFKWLAYYLKWDKGKKA